MPYYRLLMLLVLFPFASKGQLHISYPNFFTAYFQNVSQITPAYVPKEKAEFSCAYRSMTGAFRKVASYYAFGSRQFVSQKENTHLLRLQFYNDKMGSYITSPRVYVNYAYQLKLREELFCYTGIALGANSIYYSSPTVTQSSHIMPDGAIGIGIKSHWFDVGGSMMQMFNSRFTPVSSAITLHRFYHVYAFVQKEWPSEWGVNGKLLWRHLPMLYEEVTLTGGVSYGDYIELGANVSQYRGLALYSRFAIQGEQDKFHVLLTYNSAFLSSIPLWQSSLEIGLNYTIGGTY